MTNFDQPKFATALSARSEAGPVTVAHMVGGVPRFDGALLERENPSRPGSVVSRCHDAPQGLVAEAVAISRAAQKSWARLSLAERIERMRPAIAHVESALGDWAVRVALEIGKPFGPALAEAREVLDILRLFLGYAEEEGAFDDPRQKDPSGLANVSLLRPYGVFGVIVPFNYPIVQAAGPTIAALLVGNGVVIKTSHHGAWSGHAIYEMCAAMDLPEGLVNIIHGEDEPGRALSGSDIDGISFTGSVAVGKAIMTQLALGPYPRPVIAEMGGKNPVIVTESADLDIAADGIIFSAFDLGGQKCSALSRVLVAKNVHDRLVALVAERAAKLVMADPADGRAFAGPLADVSALARFEAITSSARGEGFHVVGGERLDREGYFVQPAVVSGVPGDHPLATTEHFVPFLTISPFDSFSEALALANDTPMGLTAGIYTGDLNEARQFLDEIEAGCVNVNVPGHATTGWWPGPQTFGGWKASGSSGKQGFGKWYIPQFGREQARKAPPEIADLLSG